MMENRPCGWEPRDFGRLRSAPTGLVNLAHLPQKPLREVELRLRITPIRVTLPFRAEGPPGSRQGRDPPLRDGGPLPRAPAPLVPRGSVRDPSPNFGGGVGRQLAF